MATHAINCKDLENYLTDFSHGAQVLKVFIFTFVHSQHMLLDYHQ